MCHKDARCHERDFKTNKSRHRLFRNRVFSKNIPFQTLFWIFKRTCNYVIRILLANRNRLSVNQFFNRVNGFRTTQFVLFTIRNLLFIAFILQTRSVVNYEFVQLYDIRLW